MSNASTVDLDPVPSGPRSVSPASAPGIVGLPPDAHRVAWRVAFAIMAIPALGTIEAVRLWLHHDVGVVEVALFAVMYGVHMGGVTMGLHRLLAHRAYSTNHRWLQNLLAVMGSMAGQGPVLYWVATHRAHHSYSDTPGDPHTPHIYGKGFAAKAKGLWRSHMPWMLENHIASPSHFARDLLRDRTLMVVHQTYFYWLALGFVIPAVVGGLAHHSLFGAWCGFIYGGLARMFFANHAAWFVGSACHMFGGRPFRTDDQSGNLWWVAILTFGEGLQNNHHAFPTYYRHAVRWYEPDLSGWTIGLMGRLGLVSNLKHPPQATLRQLSIK